MIVNQTPQLVASGKAGRKLVVVQNIGAAGTAIIIVGENYSQVRAGVGINVSPGNATPQLTIDGDLYVAADPAAVAGTTQTVVVVTQ